MHPLTESVVDDIPEPVLSDGRGEEEGVVGYECALSFFLPPPPYLHRSFSSRILMLSLIMSSSSSSIVLFLYPHVGLGIGVTRAAPTRAHLQKEEEGRWRAP